MISHLKRIINLLIPERKTLGQRGEDLAARHLKQSGYTILERNAVYGRNEIDIIAQKDDNIVFVEVKTKQSAAVAAPEENVGREKRKRIRSAARKYLTYKQDPTMYYRFDIIAVLIPEQGKPSIQHFENAFRDE